jgi:hypothetical protein
MKKIVLAALAATTALIATPAAAQQSVTGTVTLTGSVAPKCFVLPGAGTTFSDSVAFGELAANDGTLRTGLEADFDTQVEDVQVLCTSANPEVTVTATPLASATPAAVGYDNSIDYTAHAQFTLVGGGTTTVSDPTDPGTGTGPTPLGGRLTGTGLNVHLTATAFAATGILVSGSYAGSITVLIAPGL